MKHRLIKVAVLFAALAAFVSLFSACVLVNTVLCSHDVISEANCQSPSVCTACGVTLGDYGDHDYLTTVIPPDCVNDGVTKRVCRYCGDTKSETTDPAHGHTFGDWVITVEPTDDTDGERAHSCVICAVTVTEPISSHTHEMQEVDARDPDCEIEGYEAYEYCTVCGYNTRITIAPLGHEWGDYVPMGNGTHSRTCAKNPSHTIIEVCSGGSATDGSLPVCDLCGAEYEFAYRAGNSLYGYYAFDSYQKGEELQRLYRELTATAEKFFVSDEDITESEGYYVIGKFNVTEYGLTLEEAKAVWKIFYVSSPAYYWLDAAVVAAGETVYLTVSESYASAAYRRTCDEGIERMSAECAALLVGKTSDLERAMAISAYIVGNMEYAYESDGVTPVSDMWAHNMTGLSMYGYGVCESYAKSFMYLSLLNGVECIMGSGFAGGEAHAWNYVRLGGEWYGVDITWTDNSGDLAVYDYFGLSGDSIFEDHTPHPSDVLGISFIYEAPALAERDLELTALYKNGEYVGMYKSIADSFCAMSDLMGSYEIYIGYYSAYESAVRYSLDVSRTPLVASLTISGRSDYVGEGYLDNNSLIILKETLTLGSDLALANVHVLLDSHSAYIDMSWHRLTLAGDSVYLEPKLDGDNSLCSVIASTNRGAYLLGGADVFRVTVVSDKIIFGADSSVTYCSSQGVYTTNGAKVSILYYDRSQ